MSEQNHNKTNGFATLQALYTSTLSKHFTQTRYPSTLHKHFYTSTLSKHFIQALYQGISKSILEIHVKVLQRYYDKVIRQGIKTR